MAIAYGNTITPEPADMNPDGVHSLMKKSQRSQPAQDTDKKIHLPCNRPVLLFFNGSMQVDTKQITKAAERFITPVKTHQQVFEVHNNMAFLQADLGRLDAGLQGLAVWPREAVQVPPSPLVAVYLTQSPNQSAHSTQRKKSQCAAGVKTLRIDVGPVMENRA